MAAIPILSAINGHLGISVCVLGHGRVRRARSKRQQVRRLRVISPVCWLLVFNERPEGDISSLLAPGLQWEAWGWYLQSAGSWSSMRGLRVISPVCWLLVFSHILKGWMDIKKCGWSIMHENALCIETETAVAFTANSFCVVCPLACPSPFMDTSMVSSSGTSTHPDGLHETRRGKSNDSN